MAEDGTIGDRLIAYHEARASGGVGLIVLQVAGVHQSAKYSSSILMADTDDCIPGYRRHRGRRADPTAPRCSVSSSTTAAR